MIFVNHANPAEHGAPFRAIAFRPVRFDAEGAFGHAFHDDRLRQRLGIDPALNIARTLGAYQIELIEGFDPFHRGFDAQRVGQADDRGDDLGAVLIFRGTGIDKALVHLDLVERGGAQIAERGIAGPEIVECQAHAEFLQRLEGLVHRFAVAHEDALGQLQLQPVRFQPGAGKRFGHRFRETGVGKLQRGDVDCHAHRLRPLHRIAAGAAQRPVAKLDDEVRFLRNRDEHAGADIAAFGMFPAHQPFEADHQIVVRAHYRLIVQFQRIIGQRLAQILHQQAAFFRLVLQIGGIEAELAAPGILRGVKRKVRAVSQLVLLQPVIRRDRDPDRRPDDGALVVNRIGLRDDLDQLVGNFAQRTAIVDIGQDDLEFVTAQAPHLAPVTDNAGQAFGHLFQQFVARLVAHGVIDMLEPVEVEHHQRATALCRLVGRQRPFQLAIHAIAIGEAGQRIKFRQPRILQLALIFDGDILRAAAIAEESPGFVEFGMSGNRPPGLANIMR